MPVDGKGSPLPQGLVELQQKGLVDTGEKEVHEELAEPPQGEAAFGEEQREEDEEL